MTDETKCPDCRGDGLTDYGRYSNCPSSKCPTCKGTGKVEGQRDYRAEFKQIYFNMDEESQPGALGSLTRELLNDYDRLRAELERIEIIVADQKIELRDRSCRLEKKEKENATLKAEIGDCRKAVHCAEDFSAEYRKERDEALARVKELESTLQDYVKDHDLYVEEVRTLKADREKIRECLGFQMDENKRLKVGHADVIEDYERQIDELRARVKELEDIITGKRCGKCHEMKG